MREMSMALRYSTPDNTCWLCCLYSSSSPSATDGARAGGGDKRRKGESTVLSQRCVGCWCWFLVEWKIDSKGTEHK
jgi:hypothetical protein